MNICLVSANDVMEHFAYPGSIDFAADDQGAFSHVLFMKGCCIYSSSVKLCGIIHRFWATCRKLLDKNRLDFKASRLRIRQSNRKREIETRSHLSR